MLYNIFKKISIEYFLQDIKRNEKSQNMIEILICEFINYNEHILYLLRSPGECQHSLLIFST